MVRMIFWKKKKFTHPLTCQGNVVGVDDTSDRVMVYTACAVFLYGGTSDHPLPPLTARQHERERAQLPSVALSL
jgi:hypothetical protein